MVTCAILFCLSANLCDIDDEGGDWLLAFLCVAILGMAAWVPANQREKVRSKVALGAIICIGGLFVYALFPRIRS